jgi:hypothetical protein
VSALSAHLVVQTDLPVERRCIKAEFLIPGMGRLFQCIRLGSMELQFEEMSVRACHLHVDTLVRVPIHPGVLDLLDDVAL